MPTPQDHDPALARFRRGASTPAGPVGPPPVAPPPVFTPQAEGPITVASLPVASLATDPGIPRPLFGELVAEPLGEQTGEPAAGPGTRPGEIEPLFDAPESDWIPVDGDPGKTSGIVSIVIGVFVGIVGVFIAIFSIRRSRRAGRSGVYGFIGILVSVVSLIVAASIGLSYVRYEASLAQQCSLVGPGQYLTQSGDQVSCP